jgi:N,N'-diacetyllegionaminate synthase
MKNSGRVFIIAEAGVNHNGSLGTAMKMVDAAAAAGADAVKFQTFRAESLATRYAPKAAYQRRAPSPRGSQFDMLKKLELSPSAHKKLMARCKKRGISFISSPFDEESVGFLARLGLRILKIPSGEITNVPYLRRIGRLGRKVILSTGMSYMAEVRSAVDTLVASGTKRNDITVLHCNTEYPTPYEDVNLMAMVTMKKKIGTAVGYSDHTLGIEVPVAAVALGAVVIEKHFTLGRGMKGPDHAASLEPDELKQMVRSIRAIEKSLGSGIKKPSRSEAVNKPAVRKSICASRPIRKGEIFLGSDITMKRPGTGIGPEERDRVVGSVAKRDFAQEEMIEL